MRYYDGSLMLISRFVLAVRKLRGLKGSSVSFMTKSDNRLTHAMKKNGLETHMSEKRTVGTDGLNTDAHERYSMVTKEASSVCQVGRDVTEDPPPGINIANTSFDTSAEKGIYENTSLPEEAGQKKVNAYESLDAHAVGEESPYCNVQV